MEPESELSLLAQAFVAEFIISENATRSYREAFKEIRGHDCTYGTARMEGSRLLASPCIKAEIRAAQVDLRKRNRVKTQRVINQLAKTAFASIADVVDMTDRDNPRVKDRKEIPAEAMAAVQEISRTQFGVKIKMKDSIAALDKLARILGIYKEPEPLEILIARLLGPA